eukprot:UN33816
MTLRFHLQIALNFSRSILYSQIGVLLSVQYASLYPLSLLCSCPQLLLTGDLACESLVVQIFLVSFLVFNGKTICTSFGISNWSSNIRFCCGNIYGTTRKKNN